MIEKHLHPEESHAKYELLQIIRTILFDLWDGRKEPGSQAEKELLNEQKRLFKSREDFINSLIDQLLCKLRDKSLLLSSPKAPSLKRIKIAMPGQNKENAWRICPAGTTFKFIDLIFDFSELDIKMLLKGFIRSDKLSEYFQMHLDVLDDVFGQHEKDFNNALKDARKELIEGKYKAEGADESPIHDRAQQIFHNKRLNAPASAQIDNKTRSKVLAALLDEYSLTKKEIFDLIRPDEAHADKDRTAREMVKAGKKLISDDVTLRLQFQAEANQLYHTLK